MKKKAVVIAMAAALAVSQYAAVFAANSPGTGVVIPNEDSDGDYDIGERVDQVTGGSSSASGTGNSSAATPGGQTAAQITVPTESGTASQSGGQAVVGDTGIEFVQGSESAVSGLPETVVSTINAINTGTGLAEAGTGLDLSGYNALVGTTAVMTYQAGTRVEKTGATNMPVYFPNLVEGLGTVQVLFYNNMTSKWELITPTSVDVAKKMIHVTIPNSGTFSVIYKR